MKRLRGGWGIRREFREVDGGALEERGSSGQGEVERDSAGLANRCGGFSREVGGEGRCGEKADRKIHAGVAVSETTEEKARILIDAYLQKNKTEIAALRERRKGNPLKIQLAGELRKHTTLLMGWITEELNAGSPGSVWNTLGKGAEWDAVKGMQRA